MRDLSRLKCYFVVASNLSNVAVPYWQDGDPACHETVHNGRDVHVCICSGDKCNGADTNDVVGVGRLTTLLAAILVAGILRWSSRSARIQKIQLCFSFTRNFFLSRTPKMPWRVKIIEKPWLEFNFPHLFWNHQVSNWIDAPTISLIQAKVFFIIGPDLNIDI